MGTDPPAHRPARRKPADGVFEIPGVTTLVFVTACAKDRDSWIARPEVHSALRAIWMTTRGWLVGPYVLMPDHVHFIAAPGSMDCDLSTWMAFWKRTCTRALADGVNRWQRHHWDTRLRTKVAYEEKWQYMLANPVRKGLVQAPEDWPYVGEVHHIRW